MSAPLSRKRAWACILINLLATPGLGSLWARRYFAGSLQLILGLAGFCLTCGWILKAVYNSVQMDSAPAPVPNWIWQWGTILFSASWVWSLVTSVSLWSEASTTENRRTGNVPLPPQLKLAPAQIVPALATVPYWRQNGDAISRMFQFRDFPSAIKFVNAVAAVAETEWHHPDIDIRWNKVTLTLTTHDAGGLTERDFGLAKRFDDLSLR